MKLILTKGVTSQSIQIFIQDNSVTTGAGLTGLVYNSPSLTAYYCQPAGTATSITLATQTAGGAFSSGGFVAVDGTNMPGVYRLDVPNAALTGANSVVIMLKGATNMAQTLIEIELVSFDLQTALQSVNATQFAGQTITAAAGVTLPSSVASPTNITAGTITTVTNLTNAPTNGDLTATMKTSVTTAATAATPVAASVTGNVGGNVNGNVVGSVGSVAGNVSGSVASVAGSVGGNVTGSVGSVATGGIAAASFAAGAIDNAAIATDAIAANEIAASAVTKIQSGLATSAALVTAQVTLTRLETTWVLDGSVYQFTVNALENAPGGGGSSITVADIWNELQAGYTTPGTFGFNLDVPVSQAGSGGGSFTYIFPVMNSVTSTPVAGAICEARLSANPAATVVTRNTTDLNGNATLRFVATGTAYVWVTAQGFNPGGPFEITVV